MTVSASAPVAIGLQTFLAFDFGIKRTGVATGNRLTRTASPQPTIVAKCPDRSAVAIEAPEHVVGNEARCKCVPPEQCVLTVGATRQRQGVIGGIA